MRLWSKTSAWLGHLAVGLASVVRGSVRSFLRERGPEAAAGTAFFTVFSIFPLLIMFVAVSSIFLESAHAREKVLTTVLHFVPSATHQLIQENVWQILDSRGRMGIVGLVGLLWAASSMFNMLTRNLSRAWPDARMRNVLKARLVAIVIVVGIFLLLALFFLVQAILHVMAQRQFSFLQWLHFPELIQFLSSTAIWAFVLVLFTLLYRWVPNAHIHWLEAVAGGVWAVILGELLTAAFGWYLSSGWARYNLVYGSLGTLISFMLWTYGINIVVFWGAHVSAALAEYARPAEDKPRARADRSHHHHNGYSSQSARGGLDIPPEGTQEDSNAGTG